MSRVPPPLLHRTGLPLAVGVLLSAPLFLLAGCGNATLQEPEKQPQPAGLLGIDTSNTNPAVVGRWDPQLIEGETPAVSMALMRDGRVVYWSGVGAADLHEPGTLESYLEIQVVTAHMHYASTRVLDLYGRGPLVTTPPNPRGSREGDLFCTGHTLLPDGRLLTVGGTRWENVPVPDTGHEHSPEEGEHASEGTAVFYGLNHAQFFDTAVGAWVPTGDMHFGRWYPTVITLPDGNALVASGMVVAGTSTLQTAIERFNVSTEQWTHIGDRSLPMYARLTVVPSGPYAGRIFYSTTGQLWGPSGTDAREPTWNLQQVCNWETGSCEYLGPSLFGVRQHGTSILLPLDPADGYRARILTFGGTLQRSALATPLAELADLSTQPPRNTLAAPLNKARWMANGVLLPDGTVLATGGALVDTTLTLNQPGDYVMHAESYDPRTGQWTELAPMQVPRAYHSSALLLPDGRVLVGGHVPLPFPARLFRDLVPYMQQINETRFEIFEPPYLFRGTRPVIHSAPQQVSVGEIFNIEVSPTQELESVVLIRPAATTHGFDADQRMVRLTHSRIDGGRIRVTAPPNTNVAPPGYYMLFVNKRTSAGPVPSEARFIRVLGG